MEAITHPNPPIKIVLMKSIKITVLAVAALSICLCSCKEIDKKNETVKTESIKDSVQVPTAMSDHWKFIGASINEPGYDVWGGSSPN
ncbi:hypothetical protein JCM19274_2247 [Algibacter lectus]|uniref:Uncharacterized protein n=1 Tax=Algibacter lectus TaxID=221126 RepID=A0A090WXU9_9FLAO|nr:hypothetical protein [Algibacter lectus]GAL81073.1 hypothetical protein JCM19274_2247 [Algibacter lectus]